MTWRWARRPRTTSTTLLAVSNADVEWFGTDDTCTHGAAWLSEEGMRFGPMLEYSGHNGGFDVRTGEACAMPCAEPLRSWPVHIVDGQVCVLDTDAEANHV